MTMLRAVMAFVRDLVISALVALGVTILATVFAAFLLEWL